MIPKTIHYCWFGHKPKPKLLRNCIRSWRRRCPDYAIIEWNEENFDITRNEYCRQAFESEKWAFVTDYARLKLLYEYGGVYLDADMELLRPIDSFLCDKGFSGFESPLSVPTGIMAAEKRHPFIAYLLQQYDSRLFILEDGSPDLRTNAQAITEISVRHGLVLNDSRQTICGFTFYPHEVFCPKDPESGLVLKTPNTVAIHHFSSSWFSPMVIKLRRARWKRIKALYLGSAPIRAIKKLFRNP